MAPMSTLPPRFPQSHPTVMLVAYFNSCFIIIRQNFFPFLFLADSVKILVRKISIQRRLNFEIISFIFQLFILSVCIKKTKNVLGKPKMY
jgi:hypothetical protein